MKLKNHQYLFRIFSIRRESNSTKWGTQMAEYVNYQVGYSLFLRDPIFFFSHLLDAPVCDPSPHCRQQPRFSTYHRCVDMSTTFWYLLLSWFSTAPGWASMDAMSASTATVFWLNADPDPTFQNDAIRIRNTAFMWYGIQGEDNANTYIVKCPNFINKVNRPNIVR